MQSTIKSKLKMLPVDAWELTAVEEKRWEFYFIGHRLDQNRVVETTGYEAKVYRNLEDGSLGEAQGLIPPTASEKEIDRILDGLLYQATLVKNPPYPLSSEPVVSPAEKEIDIAGIAEDFIRAMREMPETETEDINSYEIFAGSKKKHYVNSNGVEYTVCFPDSMIEVVVNARKDGHEIELYRMFTSGTCDKEYLKEEISRALQFGRDRLIAQPTPRLGTSDVILSTIDAQHVYEYFGAHTSAGMKVRRVSSWEIGKEVCAYGSGDRISIEAVPSLANSSKDYPIDEEGMEIYDRYLIRDGVVENFWGGRQMSSYLGLAKSSLVNNWRVSGGSMTAEELRTGEYLEVVEFSDFQVDSMAGDIAGEIRLAYWHHDGKTVPVTGGSVTGSLREVMGNMRFSKETVQYDTMVIPAVTRLPNLRITGVQ